MRQFERVDSIDHLRGILAVTIMVYHYTAWSFPNWMNPGGLLSVLGYYGVSAFFIISGMSLAIAYRNRISTGSDVSSFYIKRLCRIAPLYWLAISAAISMALLVEFFRGVPAPFTWLDVIANYTLTFSFGYSKALTVGGWSIGNEIFFYLLFPCLYWLICKSLRWALVVLGVSALLLVFWAFWVVTSAGDELEAWSYYISNFNQLFFFVAGVVIGRHLRAGFVSREFCYAALAIALVSMSLASVGARSELVEGWHRIYLSCATLLLVFAVYQINWQSSSFIGRVLAFLGLISYSLYLLHPLVRSAVNIVGNRVGFEPITAFVISVVLTVLVSWLSYRLVEKPGIRFATVIERRYLNRRIAAAA